MLLKINPQEVPEVTHCFGHNDANEEKPVLIWGYFSIKTAYSYIRLHNIRCFDHVIYSQHSQNFISKQNLCKAVVVIQVQDLTASISLLAKAVWFWFGYS